MQELTEISGMSSAFLRVRRSLLFTALSIGSNDKEAPEKLGRVPSEGRGREFESRRVRQSRQELKAKSPSVV